MGRTGARALRTAVLSSVCTLILLQTSAVRGQECPAPEPPLLILTVADYFDLVQSALPSFDAAIVDVPQGSDWIATQSLRSVALALGNADPNESAQVGPVLEGRTDGSHYYRMDRDRGFVRYLSQARQFDFDTSPHTGWSTALSLAQVLTTASDINLPASEYMNPVGGCTACRVDTVRADVYEDGNPSATPMSSAEVERMVTVERRVNGLPVLGSRLRASVSNTGQVSRLLVEWPRFGPIGGGALRARSDVVNAAANAIFDVLQGAELADLTVRLVYVRTGATHTPAAEVEFIDELAGQSVLIPLVETSPDADFDDVPDASDLCGQFPNPAHVSPRDCNGDGDTLDLDEQVGEQCDRDGDRVGDPCDVCPDVADDQTDSNGDGVGDACTQTTGACHGAAAAESCDEMTGSLCADGGGSYGGDGSVCPVASAVPAMGRGIGLSLLAVLMICAAGLVFWRRPSIP